MSEISTVTLPDKDEFLCRLLKWNNDDLHYQEDFYPLLLKEAGGSLSPQGVVTVCVLAVAEYTKSMPPIMEHLIFMEFEELLSSILSHDEGARTEALRCYYQMKAA